MCIVAVAWQLFDEMPLVLMSNRDEFLNRPTLPAHQWQDMPIYAGRDEQSGGTWLGYHHADCTMNQDYVTNQSCASNKARAIKEDSNGRWATVLNFRDMVVATPEQKSRGQLVTDFLTSDLSPMAFAKQINLADYAGFNLIVGNHEQAVLVNNRGYPPTALHTGLHVISNGMPDDEWFKSKRLRTRVYQEVLPLIAEGTAKQEWQKVAFEVLSDTLQAPNSQLPTTGVPMHVEQALSSIFIEHHRLGGYGTRTQTILTLDNKKGIEFLSQEIS